VGISQCRLPSAAISIITLCECILCARGLIASGINRRVACEYAAVGISSYGGSGGTKHRKNVIVSTPLSHCRLRNSGRIYRSLSGALRDLRIRLTSASLALN